MKSNSAALFALLTHTAQARRLSAPTTATTCPEVAGYTFFPGKNSYGNGFKRMQSATLADLAESCTAGSKCKAFNTEGYLLHTVVSPMTEWNSNNPCDGMYVKTCHDWAGMYEAIHGSDNVDILLCPGKHTPDYMELHEISIDDKDISIGCADPDAGCIVKGPKEAINEVFSLEGAGADSKLRLSDLTFTQFPNGIVKMEAGSGTVAIEYCKFERTGARALWVYQTEGATMDVTNSIFESNDVAIEVDGSWGSGSVRITGSTFKNNKSAVSGVSVDGGAIACTGPGASCMIESSTFESNEAPTGMGGAIYCDNGAACGISASAFLKNKALDGPNFKCVGTAQAKTACHMNPDNVFYQDAWTA